MNAPFRLPTGELVFRRPQSLAFAGRELLQFGLSFFVFMSTLWVWAG